jgi:phosphoribosylformylglycinamidine synthase
MEIRDRELGSATTDLGGGGMSSAVGETAERFGCGVTVNLDKVPLKYAGLAPWEIYVSESQERMLLTVSPENLAKVLAIFEKEDVEATAIGELTTEKRLCLRYRGKTVANLDMPFLFTPLKSAKIAKFEKTLLEEPSFPEPSSLTEVLLKILSAPNVASKESVVRSYDHEVKGNTTVKPMQGEYAGPNDASILKPLDNSWRGVALSCGMNPNYGKIDAYWMAASAIDEAVRNNVAVGGTRIALLDNFVWGNPEKPERLGSLVKACKACYDTAKAFRTPFISGKDSLYNESPLGPVTPTLLITAVGIVPDIRAAVSMDLKAPDNLIYIVGKTFAELGGSEYYKLQGFLGKSVPKVRTPQAKKTYNALSKAIREGTIKACHDLSEGGLAVAAAEMALASDFGLELDLNKVPSDPGRDDFFLFSESNSRFLVEVADKSQAEFEAFMKGKPCALIGKVTRNSKLKIKGIKGGTVIDVAVGDLRAAWKRTLSEEA